jgi:hypothetical protein
LLFFILVLEEVDMILATDRLETFHYLRNDG